MIWRQWLNIFINQLLVQWNWTYFIFHFSMYFFLIFMYGKVMVFSVYFSSERRSEVIYYRVHHFPYGVCTLRFSSWLHDMIMWTLSTLFECTNEVNKATPLLPVLRLLVFPNAKCRSLPIMVGAFFMDWFPSLMVRAERVNYSCFLDIFGL